MKQMSEVRLSPSFSEFVHMRLQENGSNYPVPSFRAQVAGWLTWCLGQGINPETATTTDVRQYRVTLARDSRQRPTIAHKLLVLRWLYQEMVVAGLRRDNPTAGLFTNEA
jgi:site-specific recombinase XerD